MELLLLWRWSTLVQATSDLIIAVFFVSLALSLRRRELQPWLAAWLFNLSALLVTIVYWLAQPVSSRTAAVFAGFGYVFAKTMFVALMVVGADRFRGRSYADSGFATVAVVVALFAAVTALAATQAAAVRLHRSEGQERTGSSGAATAHIRSACCPRF